MGNNEFNAGDNLVINGYGLVSHNNNNNFI